MVARVTISDRIAKLMTGVRMARDNARMRRAMGEEEKARAAFERIRWYLSLARDLRKAR